MNFRAARFALSSFRNLAAAMRAFHHATRPCFSGIGPAAAMRMSWYKTILWSGFACLNVMMLSRLTTKNLRGQSGEGHGFQIWLIGVAVLAHAKGFIWAPEAMAYPCML